MRRGGEGVLGQLPAERDPEVADDLRIAERAVTRAACEPVARHHGVEIVPQLLWKKAPRELHGAQHRRAEGQVGATEFRAQESVIEAGVVGNEHRRNPGRLELVEHHPPDVGETRCGADQTIADAGETLDVRGNDALGIDERAPFLDHHPVAQPDDADLDDPVMSRVAAGRL